MERLARRSAIDRTAKVLGTGFAVISLVMLAWILFTLIERGGPALGTNVFSQITLPPGAGGGLINAIVGSFIQIGVALVIGTPLGIMAGTYLTEAGRGSRLAWVVGFANDILLSAPSILLGLFVYQMVVVTTGGFSGWAGTLALAIIILPVVARTTEDMLALVPIGLREAAFALGAPQWKVIVFITWKAARTGIVTGLLLAVARASGETAPLLFTSLGNNNWSLDLSQPMASLPVAIYQFAGSPYTDWVALAWTGALLITVGVLALNIVTRLLFSPKK